MKRIGAILVAALVLVAAYATGQPPAAEERVHINLSGVNLHFIIQCISDFTGKPVILPERFPGDRKVDIISGTRAGVPREKAVEILATTLRAAGYAMIETADFIQVVPEGTADGVPVRQQTPTGGISGQTLLTKVVDVKNAEASKLVPILSSLRSKSGSVQVYPDSNKLVITEYASQLQIMESLIRSLDTKWAGATSQTVKLEKTSVDSLHGLLTSYVRNLSQTAEPMVQKRLQGFSIFPHAPTNSFVLFGDPEDIAKVKELIRILDVSPGDAARSFHTHPVQHRDAAEMVNVLNGVFAAIKARAAGAAGDLAPAVIADPVNNAIILIAPPEKYAEYLPLLQQLDKPKAQVLIESALVELSIDKLLDLGVELATIDPPGSRPRGFGGTLFGMSAIGKDGRVPIAPPEGGLTAGVFKDSTFDIAALVRLSQRDENVVFIASPRLMASDNKPATVEIAEEREYQKSIVTPEGRTSEVTHGGFLKAAITLEITPHISEEGTVRLQIKQVTEQFLPSTNTETGPLTNKTSRMASTEVVVPDGSMVVIAGLTRNAQIKTIRKVPIAGDIPLLGFLFRRTETTNQQRNLCVFITPHILRSREELAAHTGQAKDRLRDMNAQNPQLRSEAIEEELKQPRLKAGAPAKP